METIYIYYKKRNLFFGFLISLFCFLGTAADLYDTVFYDKITYQISRKVNIVVKKIYIPFSFPDSLYRINYLTLLAFLLFLFCCCAFLMGLVHKGFVYSITSQGITDYTYRFLPWSEVKTIGISMNKNDKHIFLTLKDCAGYFGKYKSLFGTRKIILSPSIMQCEQFNDWITKNNINLIEKL